MRINTHPNEAKSARALAVLTVPRGYRIVQDNELAREGDKYYVLDELNSEDIGNAGTWQTASLVMQGERKTSLTNGGNFFCLIRAISPRDSGLKRILWWYDLKREQYRARWYLRINGEPELTHRCSKCRRVCYCETWIKDKSVRCWSCAGCNEVK